MKVGVQSSPVLDPMNTRYRISKQGGPEPGSGGFVRDESLAVPVLSLGVAFALWLAAGNLCGARAASATSAQKHFEAGQYAAAQAEYQKLLREKPDDSRLSYNAATAAYKRGDLTNAVLGFENALATQDLKLQQKAYYNLGNSQFQLGDKAAAPEEKIAHWEESLKHFGSALQLQPEDSDAKHNQAFVQRLLEELKKQQPKQSSKQDSKKDDKNDDKKEDSDKNESKDQQSKDSEKQQDEKDSNKDGQSQDKQDSGSKDDAQQQQQQQQDQQDSQKDGQQSKDDPKEGKGESQQGKDAESEGKDKAGQSKPDAQAQKEADEERKAAALGKMTPQMAEKLLDAQKANEKAIPFRVIRQDSRKGKERSFKNW